MRTLIAALALALLPTGCGGVELFGHDDGPFLSTMGFSLPDEIATARADSFKVAHPDIELRISESKFDEQQFLSAVAAGDPPDVVYLERDKLGSYAARGAVEPIDQCLARERVDTSIFYDSAVDQIRYRGQIYGLPDFNVPRVLIVNKAVAPPGGVNTTDWNQLRQQAEQMSAHAGGRLTRIGFDPKLPEMFPLWARANGAALISEDGASALLDDPRAVEALATMTGLVTQQASWPEFRAFRDGFDLFGKDNPYVSDQLGAMAMETWYLNVLSRTTPDVNIEVSPVTDRQGNVLTYVTGQAWAIPKGAAHPDTACQLIAHMTRTEVWVEAARVRKQSLERDGKLYTGTYTGNQKADEVIFSEVYQPVPYPALDHAVKVALDSQKHGFALAPSPANAEIVAAWEGAVSRVLLGSQTPEQAMAQAQREAQAALDRRR